MNKLEEILTVGMTLLALSACDSKPKNISEQYISKKAIQEEIEKISELEGKIIKTRTSRITFSKEGSGDKKIASQHEFEYVVVEDRQGNIHTLIYPYAKPILERAATIKYNPLNGNILEGKDFVAKFLSRNYITEDIMVIEAEGIIVKDGIEYKRF